MSIHVQPPRTYGNFVGGKQVDAANGATFPSTNPTSGSHWGNFALSSAADVDLAVKNAHAAFSGPWGKLSPTERGKRLTSLNLLSGGERALAALAFLFALAFARPCPFYVLDEVDAALDDANIERFLELVARERERAQFVIITHQKRTMDVADVLYGVSMAGDGISRVLSRRVPRGETALAE